MGNPRVGQPVHDLRQILKPDVVIGGKQGSSLNRASLTPKPLASSVYVHVLEAPPPLKRSMSVTSPFPSPNQDEIIRDCSVATGADSKIARQEQGESTWDPLNASELAPNSANGLIPRLIAWAKSQSPGNIAIVSIIIGDFPIGSRWSDPQVHGSNPSSRAMPHSAQGPSEGRSERTIGESLRERPILTKRFTFLPHFLGNSSRRIGAVFLSPSAH